jgi:adenylate kinase
MNLALIGPSGVGKGTLADQLIAKFNLLHLVTGELFREKLERRRALGILAKKYMARGELVPDELVDAMVEEWLWDAPADRGVLFDGFPRTIYQARFLDLLFTEMGRRLEAVIYMKAPAEVVMERLSGRMICHNCQASYHLKFKPPAKADTCDRCGGQLYQRLDDIPEIARVRLRAFYRVTGPLLDYYQETKRLIIIDGAGEIDQVGRTLLAAVEAVQRREARIATPEEVAALKDRLRLPTPVPVLQKGIHLVLIGGPGSGKGTQAEYLKTALKLKHISTGDLFRENLKNETDLGRLAKTYMDRGELVPDEVTEAMVEERLSRLNRDEGFILDGFPRTLPQAEALTEIMAGLHRQLTGVLYIKVSDAEIVERLSGRLICRECQSSFHKIYNPFKTCPYNKCNGEYLYQRDDDNPETVKSRLKTFHHQTAPLIDYYKEASLLIEVEGEGDVSAIKQKMLAAAQNLMKS